jgi:hypothetical protein
VAAVEGDLIKLNRRALPNLPIKEGLVARKLSLFVDWGKDPKGPELKGLPQHGRVLSLNLRFSDRYGNAYNYLAFKGVGMPRRSSAGHLHSQPVAYPGEKLDPNVYGLERDHNALADWYYSDLLLRAGARTTVPIAIIRPREVLTKEGERIGIADAVREGYIPRTWELDGRRRRFVPVIYVKGFGEVARLLDMRDCGYKRVAAELGVGVREYGRLLSEEVARNLAILHNLGLTHGYLFCHNVTLDGCIVDFDSVYSGGPLEVVADLRRILQTLTEHGKLGGASELRFMEAYFRNREGIPKEERGELRDWMAFKDFRRKADWLLGLSR